MKRALEIVLSLAAAASTAMLVGLLARYDVGMTNATIRTGALSAASVIFAALAGGALLKRK